MYQSVLFPLPAVTHFIFVLVCAGFLLVSFFRKKRVYKLILAADIALTLSVYVCGRGLPFDILGISEIVLFALTVIVKRLEAKDSGLFFKKPNGEHFYD